MNSISDYYFRKNIEIKLLNGKMPTQNEELLDNITNINNIKLISQANLKCNYIKDTFNYQNTNKNSQKYKNDKLSFEYEYQRYDIDIKLKNYLELFYNLNCNSYEYIFTNCGMSAIFSTFYALKNLSYKIEYRSNIYVETERLLNDYLSFNIKYLKKALFLDTVSYNSLDLIVNEIDLNNYDLFVIDTTLYSNYEMNGLINRIVTLNKPLILIKSHTKMDMLGIEWGNVGSICILNCKKELMKVLIKEIKIVLSFIGGFAYPNSIPLFWSDNEFKKVTIDRNNIIKANTEYIYRKLRSTLGGMEIIKPSHNMFLIIKPNKYIDYKSLESDLHEYCEHSKLKGLINYADSFGLDCFGFNGYYENMAAETEVIRISPSDYPINICDLIIDDFIGWLVKYLELDCD